MEELALIELQENTPALTEAYGTTLAEAASVCFDSQGHPKAFNLAVVGDFTKAYTVNRLDVTDEMMHCYNDLVEATEYGAYGVAILMAQKLTGYSVLEKSRRGTGFDYWLGDTSDLPFQNKARLEVSGILRGGDSEVNARVARKNMQTKRSDGILPAYVVVVEFSRPISKVAKRG
jgi:hypothetical protein